MSGGTKQQSCQQEKNDEGFHVVVVVRAFRQRVNNYPRLVSAWESSLYYKVAFIG